MQNFLFDSNPILVEIDSDYIEKIEEKIKLKISLTEEEVNYYLKVLAYKIRITLTDDIENESFRGKCSYAQCMAHYYLEKLNINHYMHRTIHTIDSKITDHYFLVLELLVDGQLKSYIFDPTYRQFFKENICIKDDENIKIPGKYFMKHPEYKQEVEELLQNGYIEMNDKNAKMYGDSFYFSKDTINPELPAYMYQKLFKKDGGVVAKTEEELNELGLTLELRINKKTR